MSKSKLSIALFVFLFSITGFFIGLLSARLLIPKGVGLAGGAMVLGYGVLGLAIALVAGLIVQRFLSPKALKWSSIGFGLFILGMMAWVGYQATM